MNLASAPLCGLVLLAADSAPAPAPHRAELISQITLTWEGAVVPYPEDTVVLRRDGTATYTESRPLKKRLYNGTIAKGEFALLAKYLVEHAYFDLKGSYLTPPRGPLILFHYPILATEVVHGEERKGVYHFDLDAGGSSVALSGPAPAPAELARFNQDLIDVKRHIKAIEEIDRVAQGITWKERPPTFRKFCTVIAQPKQAPESKQAAESTDPFVVEPPK